LIQYIGKYLAKKADSLTVQNQGMKDVISKCGYPREKTTIIPNLLDPNFLKKPKNQKKIIYVGRMGRHKGPDMVIKAYNNLPEHLKREWSLDIYGKGPLKTEIESYIEENEIENAEVKYSPYSELPKIYSKAGLLIHSSKYTEPFSRTWLEAMASGTPILCSKNPSSKAVLNTTAELYDAFSVRDLTNSLSNLLRSPSRREKMKNKGLKEVDQYKPAKVGKLYRDAYYEMIN
jgi:glycosyltransferase involved in cell wall biosynthesis